MFQVNCNGRHLLSGEVHGFSSSSVNENVNFTASHSGSLMYIDVFLRSTSC